MDPRYNPKHVLRRELLMMADLAFTQQHAGDMPIQSWSDIHSSQVFDRLREVEKLLSLPAEVLIDIYREEVYIPRWEVKLVSETLSQHTGHEPSVDITSLGDIPTDSRQLRVALWLEQQVGSVSDAEKLASQLGLPSGFSVLMLGRGRRPDEVSRNLFDSVYQRSGELPELPEDNLRSHPSRREIPIATKLEGIMEEWGIENYSQFFSILSDRTGVAISYQSYRNWKTGTRPRRATLDRLERFWREFGAPLPQSFRTVQQAQLPISIEDEEVIEPGLLDAMAERVSLLTRKAVARQPSLGANLEQTLTTITNEELAGPVNDLALAKLLHALFGEAEA